MIGEARQFRDELVTLLRRPALLPLSVSVNSFRSFMGVWELKQSEENIKKLPLFFLFFLQLTWSSADSSTFAFVRPQSSALPARLVAFHVLPDVCARATDQPWEVHPRAAIWFHSKHHILFSFFFFAVPLCRTGGTEER